MIYIICPSHIATGGTELLHQLHYHLRELGVESSMYYIGRFEGSPVQEKFYNIYKPVISSKIVDSKSNILISPETHFIRMFKYIRIRKVCWWLSVDNFCGIVRKDETHINKIKHYLIRIWFDLKAKKFVHFVQSEYAKEYVDELGMTIGECLLTPTKIYVKEILSLMKKAEIKGISNITGGGFIENIPRCLPKGKGLCATIQEGTWPVLPIFDLMQKRGEIDRAHMYNTFNMGIGMVLVCDKENADKILAAVEEMGEKAYVIGRITKNDEKEVEVCLK